MARLLTVLSIFFAAAGLFVSTSLSLAHANGAVLPCGTGGGCEAVANDPHSHFLGFPVAYFGVAGYLALLCAAVLSASPRWDRAAKVAGLSLSFAGTAASGFLTSESLAVIHATCAWCLASAGLMTVLLVVHTLRLKPRFDDTVAFGTKAAVAGVLAAGAIGGAYWLEEHSKRDFVNHAVVDASTIQELAPATAHSEGRPDAPVILVEFADFACPACRDMHSRLERALSHSKNLRLVYHHFPLTYLHGHEASEIGSICSEIAAEKGLFWQFSDQAFNGPGHPTQADYEAILRKLGIMEPVAKRLADPTDPALQRFQADKKLGTKLGIKLTPVFVVFSPKLGPIATTNVTLLDVLERKEIYPYVTGQAARSSLTPASRNQIQ